jgi:hypothetical protein
MKLSEALNAPTAPETDQLFEALIQDKGQKRGH